MDTKVLAKQLTEEAATSEAYAALQGRTLKTEDATDIHVRSLNLYALYDSKIEAYTPPFVAQSDREAIAAAVSDAIRENSKVSTFASDYTLFRIGEWDERNAGVQLLITPASLGLVHQLRDAYFRKEGMTQ